MLIPASVALIALQAIPTPLAPADRNLSALLQSAEGAQFFLGNWGWFALVVLMLVFNTVIGEERRSCSGS